MKGRPRDPAQSGPASAFVPVRKVECRMEDFDYELPQELVAQTPPLERGASRLLVADRKSGTLSDKSFADFPGYPAPGDVLVVNDTKVFPARLDAQKSTGGKAEILLVRPKPEAAKKLRAGGR